MRESDRVRRGHIVLLCVVMTGLTSAAFAQTTPYTPYASYAQHGPVVEVQPFLGYRFGGSFDIDDPRVSGFDVESSGIYGFTVGWILNPEQQLDILWSHQDTSLDVHGSVPGHGDTLSGVDIDYFQIEGSYISGALGDKVRPFAAFGMGATHLGAPSGFSGSRTHFAVSIGGGAKVYLGKVVGLRFQGRWTPTFYNSSETLFCSSNSGCFATINGGVVSQIEVTAGVMLQF